VLGFLEKNGQGGGVFWIEMSRDLLHGGSGWGFGECLWSPTRQVDGKRSGWWENLSRVRPGEGVVHLRGRDDEAAFVAISRVGESCVTTRERPPYPGEWEFASDFYRVPLTDFQQLTSPIPLKKVFRSKQQELWDYFQSNQDLGSGKRTLFFNLQGGNLRCQNGAYLSELDQVLASIILDVELAVTGDTRKTIDTGTTLLLLTKRIGQAEFSAAVRENFLHRCCFLGCDVEDSEFLVGAHIARWTDFPELRGRVDNGLCLCLMHDRAFEEGYFTIDRLNQIVVSEVAKSSSWAVLNLFPQQKTRIKQPRTSPATECLMKHWSRHKFEGLA
jgi:putative restriction endonuclease